MSCQNHIYKRRQISTPYFRHLANKRFPFYPNPLIVLDLFLFHGVSTLEDWRQLRFEELAGLSRFRGISSHNPAVLREAIPSGFCDVVMFPIGAAVDERYITEILPLARQHRVGTIGIKTFGGR